MSTPDDIRSIGYSIGGGRKINRSIGGQSVTSNLRVASVNVQGDEKVLVEFTDAPEPPDGGWGWVVCFACFMGITKQAFHCIIRCVV